MLKSLDPEPHSCWNPWIRIRQKSCCVDRLRRTGGSQPSCTWPSPQWSSSTSTPPSSRSVPPSFQHIPFLGSGFKLIGIDLAFRDPYPGEPKWRPQENKCQTSVTVSKSCDRKQGVGYCFSHRQVSLVTPVGSLPDPHFWSPWILQ